MTHSEYFEEEYYQEEYLEQEDDRRCIYEQRWWDYTYYEDSRFL